VRRSMMAAASVLVLVVAACGDDDDGGTASAEAYCALAAELDQAEEQPSDAQLDEILEAAPEEIRDDLQVIIDAIQTGNFDDEAAIEEAESNLLAFEEENCGDTFGGEQEE
jgi:hypothetical protein